MKKICRMLVLGVFAGLLFGGMLWAEDGDRSGSVRGTFVQLVEREVGEQAYMGIVIKPFERDDHVTVLVPRQREEIWRAARSLQEGQKIGIFFVTEAGHKFIKGMETERREVVEDRDRPEGRRRMIVRREVVRRDEDEREKYKARRPAHILEQMEGQLKEVVAGHLERMGRALKEVLGEHLERMEAELRELREHIERMQEELQELRAQNERLKRQLRERSGPEREREIRIQIRREGEERREVERRREGREREERDVRTRRVVRRDAELSLPEGMKGFRGVLVGKILRKLDRGFVLSVERVTKVWEHNKADRPEAAVGKELIITIRADDELGGRFLRTLRNLETGERVLVEAFHFEGNHLSVVEQLQRAD